MTERMMRMVWVVAAVVVVYMVVDAVREARLRKAVEALKEEYKELNVRVNVNDEVITLHSEELDEIQRHELARKMVRELEEQSGKVCVIHTGKGDDDGESV